MFVWNKIDAIILNSRLKYKHESPCRENNSSTDLISNNSTRAPVINFYLIPKIIHIYIYVPGMSSIYTIFLNTVCHYQRETENALFMMSIKCNSKITNWNERKYCFICSYIRKITPLALKICLQS